jgi:hypothetical protein
MQKRKLSPLCTGDESPGEVADIAYLMTPYDNLNIIRMMLSHDLEVYTSTVDQVKMAHKAGYRSGLVIDCPILMQSDLSYLNSLKITVVVDGSNDF